MFQMDDVNFTDIQHHSESESDEDSLLVISNDSRLMVDKLDTVMVMVFNYIDNRKQNPNELTDLFYSMIDAFDRIMLPTHKLRCAQFLLFYICSLVPETFPEDFMGLLVTHLLEVSDSAMTRMASAAYLGSFIARAKFLDISSIRHCLKLLNNLCQNYIDNHETDVTVTNQVDVFFF